MTFRRPARAAMNEQEVAYAWRAVTMRKPIPRTLSDVVFESGNGNGAGVVYAGHGTQLWRVRFYRVEGMLRAQLHTPRLPMPLIALDHHRGRATDAFGGTLRPNSYHWDVMPPVGPDEYEKARIPIDNDINDPYDAVHLVACMWNLELQTEPSRRLS